jgi:hypothetical protein
MEPVRCWEAVSSPPYITGSNYSPPRQQELPFVPILSQMSPIQASTPYSSKTHIRIIPHIDLCSPTGFFHWGLPIKTVHAFLYPPDTCHMTQWSEPLFILSPYSWDLFCDDQKSWSFAVSSVLQLHVVSSFLGPNISWKFKYLLQTTIVQTRSSVG